MRHAQIDHGEHHKDKRLQQNYHQMKKRPQQS
jgi:hypothetical protein